MKIIAVCGSLKFQKEMMIVAEKIALTENYKFITIDDIAQELRDGKNGIDGIGANGKLRKIIL